jgi:hypothetical protein
MAQHLDTLQELRAPIRSLRHAVPATWAGFTDLHDAAMAEGEVLTRLKEAVALAVGAAAQLRDGRPHDRRVRRLRHRRPPDGRPPGLAPVTGRLRRSPPSGHRPAT